MHKLATFDNVMCIHTKKKKSQFAVLKLKLYICCSYFLVYTVISKRYAAVTVNSEALRQ